MTTALKGNSSEAAVLAALVKRDFAVLLPFGEGHPYDLAVHLGGDAFFRVQCKTSRVRNGVMLFNTRSTDHGRGQGCYHGLADLFGVHCPESDSSYLVPVADVPKSLAFLRVEPPRNNQRRGIRYAADYEMSRWTLERLLELSQEPGALRPALTLA